MWTSAAHYLLYMWTSAALKILFRKVVQEVGMSKGSFFVGVDVGKVELRAAVKRLSQKSCRFARYQIQQRSAK
jgi:hypothetical protein